MNNKLHTFKTHLLIVFALLLSSTSSPAQTKKLSDWLNVQVEKKKVKLEVNSQAVADSIFKQFEQTNSPVTVSTTVPSAKTISNSPPVGAPPAETSALDTSTTGTASPPPGQSVLPTTTDSVPPPAVAALPPTTVNESAATTVTSAADGTASTPAVIAPPSIKIVPLTKIQSWYDRIKEGGPESGRTFRVSRDGEHCVSVQRLGLTAWTVQIDGQPGPEFTAIIGEIFPSKDFSRVFYLAQDANSRRVLVTQDRKGSAKTYPSPEGSGIDPASWVLSVEQSLENCRLIRTRKTVTPEGDPKFQVQVDENGPVLGPFSNEPKLSFDELGKHYLLSGPVSSGVYVPDKPQSRMTPRSLLTQPVLFFDGTRVGQSLLPDVAPSFQQVKIQTQQVLSNGGYWVQFGDTKALLNGREKFEFPGGRHLIEPVFSPDGNHVASVLSTDQGKIVHRNGKIIASYPVGARLENLKFTDDSQSLMYTVSVSPMTSVFVDGQPVFTISDGFVDRLWAGPQRGQYACLAGNRHTQDLVINGHRLPLATTTGVAFTPKQLWFTSNGEHVYGHGQASGNPVVAFFDNATAKAEMNGKPFSPGELLEGVASDDSRWQMVGSNRPGTVARTFFRIEVGSPLSVAQAN